MPTDITIADISLLNYFGLQLKLFIFTLITGSDFRTQNSKIKSTIIWNASLSLKQANKHSKINKQNTFIFSYPTLKENRKIMQFFWEKNGSLDSAFWNVYRFWVSGIWIPAVFHTFPNPPPPLNMEVKLRGCPIWVMFSFMLPQSEMHSSRFAVQICTNNQVYNIHQGWNSAVIFDWYFRNEKICLLYHYLQLFIDIEKDYFGNNTC